MTGKETLKSLLSRQVVLGDGAMGTMLYQQGVFLNTCFDELNLKAPDMIKKVHQAYINAGADFIETNTFGANSYKLAKYGLGDQVEQINTAATQIAKQAAGENALVAGAIGPLGRELTWHSSVTAEQASQAFAQQAKALAAAGVDFLILETFANTEEILVAIKALTAAADLPIVAQMTVGEENETPYGEKIEQAIERIAAQSAVVAVGLNCSTGPAGMLNSIERIHQVTDKPLSVMPNAGLPREIEGRTLYMSTPEYMAEYAKRFYEKGAKIIGGCCGTTPDHIREMAKAVKAIDKAAASAPEPKIAIESAEKTVEGLEPIPLGKRSKIGQKLAQGQKITAIEITPPRGTDLTATLEKVRLCAENGIDAINIPDGPRASSRVSPMVTAIMIQQQIPDIETILHVCCRDRNLIGMQSDMLGASAIGLANMLLVTGDPPKVGEYPDVTGVFDLDAIALTAVVQNLNRGVDIGHNVLSKPLGLTVGVGANPVATDLEREIDRFEQKVEAGAEYAITQPVFDVDMLFNFLDRIESYRIPIIAGIWPLVSYKNAEFMANEVPGVVVPDELLDKMSKAATKPEGVRMGIEIAQEMIERINDRVEGFAVSAPFGKVKIPLAVMGKIDIDEV